MQRHKWVSTPNKSWMQHLYTWFLIQKHRCHKSSSGSHVVLNLPSNSTEWWKHCMKRTWYNINGLMYCCWMKMVNTFPVALNSALQNHFLQNPKLRPITGTSYPWLLKIVTSARRCDRTQQDRREAAYNSHYHISFTKQFLCLSAKNISRIFTFL